MRQQTQKEQITIHLMGGRTVTPLEALNLYGCFRLAAVIHTLRNEGMNIKTHDMTINDKTFAKYELIMKAQTELF